MSDAAVKVKRRRRPKVLSQDLENDAHVGEEDDAENALQQHQVEETSSPLDAIEDISTAAAMLNTKKTFEAPPSDTVHNDGTAEDENNNAVDAQAIQESTATEAFENYATATAQEENQSLPNNNNTHVPKQTTKETFNPLKREKAKRIDKNAVWAKAYKTTTTNANLTKPTIVNSITTDALNRSAKIKRIAVAYQKQNNVVMGDLCNAEAKKLEQEAQTTEKHVEDHHIQINKSNEGLYEDKKPHFLKYGMGVVESRLLREPNGFVLQFLFAVFFVC